MREFQDSICQKHCHGLGEAGIAVRRPEVLKAGDLARGPAYAVRQLPCGTIKVRLAKSSHGRAGLRLTILGSVAAECVAREAVAPGSHKCPHRCARPRQQESGSPRRCVSVPR